MTQPTSKSPSSPNTGRQRSSIALVVVPLLLFAGIGWFAPNFVQTDGVRQDPIGGDFLQEYAGGTLFRDSRQNNQLYNVDICRKIQHDDELLGFEWNEDRFFPMVYPPFYYAVVSVFSSLDYLVAARLWLLLMTVFLVLGLALLKRNTNLPVWMLVLACFAPPLLLSMTTGQKSAFLFLILTTAWCLLRNKKPFSAGAIFGLIAFKPHLGIPIGLFMIARRQWNFVIGCYFTVCLLIVGSLMTGFDICTDYFGVTMGFGNYVHNDGYHLEQGYSLWSAWQLALGDAATARTATIISTLLILGGTAWFLRKPACFQGDNLARSFSAMTIATILVAPHLYSYDLAMLLLPVLLLSQIAMDRPPVWQNYLPVVALSLLMFGLAPLTFFAGVTGLQAGVLLMIVAWFYAIKSTSEDSAALESVTPIGQLSHC